MRHKAICSSVAMAAGERSEDPASDYLVYHNTETRGPLRRSHRFAIDTAKSLNGKDGATIWVIAGEGTPRQYFLVERFVASRITVGPSRNTASGIDGVHFEPPIRIDREPWFADLRRRHGSFAWGFSRLRPEEVALLSSLTRISPSSQTDVAVGRGGFGDPDANPEIERAAVSYATSCLEKDGWTVQSVETTNCGYDLLCTRSTDSLHVEVKGTRGKATGCILTANEHRTAGSDPSWQLWIVAGCPDAPEVGMRVRGMDLDRHFDIQPFKYRLALRRQETRDGNPRPGRSDLENP